MNHQGKKEIINPNKKPYTTAVREVHQNKVMHSALRVTLCARAAAFSSTAGDGAEAAAKMAASLTKLLETTNVDVQDISGVCGKAY